MELSFTRIGLTDGAAAHDSEQRFLFKGLILA